MQSANDSWHRTEGKRCCRSSKRRFPATTDSAGQLIECRDISPRGVAIACAHPTAAASTLAAADKDASRSRSRSIPTPKAPHEHRQPTGRHSSHADTSHREEDSVDRGESNRGRPDSGLAGAAVGAEASGASTLMFYPIHEDLAAPAQGYHRRLR